MTTFTCPPSGGGTSKICVHRILILMTTFTCPPSGGGTSKICVTQSPDFNDDLYMSSEWRRHK